MKTYLKTFGRMFVRHATRLVSVVLMVLVSVGFTAGIGMAKDKIGDSLSEYYTAQNVSDIILMNEDGAFSDADVSAISEHYGADNVQTGGMLEFEVRDGKAIVNDTEVTFTNVPDGVVRVYLFPCDAPEDVTQNTLTTVETFDRSAAPENAITVYTERATEQFSEPADHTFTLSATITEHYDEYEVQGYTLTDATITASV